MFSVEPPDKNTLDVFSRYLQSRSFFLLTEDGRAYLPEKRKLYSSEAETAAVKFKNAGNTAGIGSRHNCPMLYHFIITEPENNTAKVEFAILEYLEDLPRMTEHIFFFAAFFLKIELQTLLFPCIPNFNISDFYIHRKDDCLQISPRKKL